MALWLWTALILASTLLAKRHAFLDLCAGGMLGWAAFVALFRTRPFESPESEALQATLRARRGLLQGREAEVMPLFRHDWRKRAWEFSFFVSLSAAGVYLTARGLAASRLPLLAVGIVITSLALNAFVLLMHEGMHSTLFRSPRWNRMVSVLLGSTFLMSFSAYRVLHTRHHNFLGDLRDPDDYQNYTKRPVLLWFLHFVRMVVGPLLYLALIPILALKYGSDQERRAVLVEYGVLLSGCSLALRFVPASFLLAGWLLPLLIVGMLTAIRGFTQHGITDAKDPYIASRTILPHPVVGFFLLHENYHLEHHLFPEVPSYHLTRLHHFVWPRLPRAVSGRSYLGFIAGFLRATPRLDDTPIGLETPPKHST
jgi:fatty acid desaturase